MFTFNFNILFTNIETFTSFNDCNILFEEHRDLVITEL